MKAKQIHILLLFLGIVFLSVSCKRFIFGEVEAPHDDDTIFEKKIPRSGAEIYYGDEAGQTKLPVDKNADVPNPDPHGAFADWYTCLVMIKEGHPHGGAKMHGNYVYTRAPWRQEQFAQVHNRKEGIKVEIDKKSVVTFLEQSKGKEGPEYFRVLGGPIKLWGLCLYFYDKEGRLLNDSILRHSDQYQIFFSISDTDSAGKAYDVMDVRCKTPDEAIKDEIPTPITGEVAEYFKDKTTFEARQKATPQVFTYSYRDTWYHDDMADGVRELFNIRLLPPLTSRQMYDASSPEDVDCVGLKGHLLFDFEDEGLDGIYEWPLPLKGDKVGFPKKYNRPSYLLPQFYLAVRVMKCEPGSKALTPMPEGRGGLSQYICAPFYLPNPKSGWKEIIRFNLPIKVYTSTYDSDPTNVDPHEPYYFHLGREIGLTPEEAFEASSSNIIHSGDGSGGLGYGAWFL